MCGSLFFFLSNIVPLINLKCPSVFLLINEEHNTSIIYGKIVMRSKEIRENPYKPISSLTFKLDCESHNQLVMQESKTFSSKCINEDVRSLKLGTYNTCFYVMFSSLTINKIW